jgi:hypothetical protein
MKRSDRYPIAPVVNHAWLVVGFQDLEDQQTVAIAFCVSGT